MRRHGVDCASLARGVKVVNEKIFLLQWKLYLNLPRKVVTSNRNPSHCTHSSHRYSRQQVDRQFEFNRHLCVQNIFVMGFTNWVKKNHINSNQGVTTPPTRTLEFRAPNTNVVDLVEMLETPEMASCQDCLGELATLPRVGE